MTRRRLIGLILLSLAFAGCPSPAAPPTPPAEIPSLLVFPESVGIDLSKVAPSSGPPALSVGERAIKAQSEEPDLSFVISEGAQRILDTNDVLDGLLFPFQSFEIPVSPTVTTFEGHLEFEGGGLPQDFKFDFSAYDFDDDGRTEDCTGTTCPIGGPLTACPAEAAPEKIRPVCFRIWIKRDPEQDFERVMAGLFDVLPVKDDPETEEDEENPGKGRFRVGRIQTTTFGSEDPSVDSNTERFLIGVLYDHKDPAGGLDKSTEFFLLNDVVDSGEVLLSQQLHGFVAQAGKKDPSGAATLEKTTKSRFQGFVAAGVEGPEEFNTLFEDVGRFREDADFWSGSFHAEGDELNADVPTTCARISTAEEVSQNICLDLGIDTGGEEFPGAVTESDVVFPEDFPESPTF